jgi:hypothetical protein
VSRVRRRDLQMRGIWSEPERYDMVRAVAGRTHSEPEVVGGFVDGPDKAHS